MTFRNEAARGNGLMAKRIYVGNLRYETRSADLERLFS